MAKGIEKLELKRFRGATTSTVLEFDSSKLVVMLFGENGTGKSTVIDAIDLMCNENFGPSQRSSVVVKSHLPSLGAPIGEVSLSLTYDGQIWNARHDGKKVNFDRKERLPVAHILRRGQLLNLVEAEPAKRYDAIKKFIDVAGVESCEESLKRATAAAEKRADEASKALVSSQEILDDLWRGETTDATTGALLPGVDPGESSFAWAARKSQVDMGELATRVGALEAKIRALDNLEAALEAQSSARVGAESTAMQVESAHRELQSIAVKSSQESVLHTLQEALRWLAQNSETNACPVCEQPVDAPALQDALKERLEELGHLRQASAKVEQTSFAQRSAQVVVDSAFKKLTSAVAALQKVAPGLVPANPATATASEWENALSRRQELGQRLDTARRDLNQFNAIRSLHSKVEWARSEAEEAVALARRFNAALQVVRAQRHAFTKDILLEISTECNRLYNLLHPGEQVGNIQFKLDEKRRASLVQHASFEGHDGVVPQAYFSESHLDTLGFCLFMALARRQSGKDAIIVLDDVFTSVDSQHLRRIVDLLKTEAATLRQIIITTHYRFWRDRFRYLSGSNEVVQLMELSGWTLKNGVRPSKSLYGVEELQVLLGETTLNRQGLASLSGVLLEAALDHLTFMCRCKLARKADTGYTLDELSSALNQDKRPLQVEYAPKDATGTRVVSTTKPLKPMLDKIQSDTFIRNQVGGHFNLAGSDISDAEVRGFGQLALELLETLVCSGCGVVVSKTVGEAYACKCGDTRLVVAAKTK